MAFRYVDSDLQLPDEFQSKVRVFKMW
jgi:hypothetical protein